jgi:hypothetical protein
MVQYTAILLLSLSYIPWLHILIFVL